MDWFTNHLLNDAINEMHIATTYVVIQTVSFIKSILFLGN